MSFVSFPLLTRFIKIRISLSSRTRYLSTGGCLKKCFEGHGGAVVGFKLNYFNKLTFPLNSIFQRHLLFSTCVRTTNRQLTVEWLNPWVLPSVVCMCGWLSWFTGVVCNKRQRQLAKAGRWLEMGLLQRRCRRMQAGRRRELGKQRFMFSDQLWHEHLDQFCSLETDKKNFCVEVKARKCCCTCLRSYILNLSRSWNNF